MNNHPEIELIKEAAERFGLPILAARAGVAYTTLASAASRGFAWKSLDVVERLHIAAVALLADPPVIAPADL